MRAQGGDSILNIGAAMEGWPAQGLVAQIYVEDSDAVFERAVQAGARVIMPGHRRNRPPACSPKLLRP